MDVIPLISITLEAIIALVALYAAIKGRRYMVGLAVTFGIYVYYDLARLYAWETSEQVLQIMFLIATITAFVSVISMVRDK